MTDRAQPGAIDSLIRNDELAQIFSQFSDGWVVPGSDPTPAAQRRSDIDETALDAFTLSTSASSLDVTVAPGEAFVGGWCVRDVSTTLPLPTDATSEIVVGWNPDAVYDPDTDADRDAADETIVALASDVNANYPTAVVHEVTTDGSGVTGASRVASVGPAIDAVDAAAVSADTLEADDQTINNSLTGPAGNTTTNLTKLGGEVYYQETEPTETPDPTNGAGGVWYPEVTLQTDTVWTETQGDVFSSNIDSYNGTVFWGTSSGNVYAYNLNDGSKVWDRIQNSNNAVKGLRVFDGTVVYGASAQNFYYGLDATDGSELWSYDAGDEALSGIDESNGTVVAGSFNNNTIHGFNLSDGVGQWTFTADGRVKSGAAISNGTAVMAEVDTGFVYGLDLSNGSEQWSYQASGDVLSGIAIENGTVVFGDRDNIIYGISLSDGTEEWTFTTGGRVESGAAISNGTAIIGSYDNNIYAVDITDGSQIWSFSTGDIVTSGVDIVDGLVVMGSFDNSIYGLNLADGTENWSVSTSDSIRSGATISENRAVMGNDSGEVTAVRATELKKYGTVHVSTGQNWVTQQ